MTKEEIYNKFVECGKKSRFWINECKLLLPSIYKLRIWEEKGYSSIYVFAQKIAGLSEWQVRDAIRVVRNISDKPALMKIARKKGIGSVRPVSTIATTEDEGMWAKKADELSIHELKAFVRSIRGQEVDASNNEKRAEQKEITITLEKSVATQLEKLSNGNYNKLFKEFLEMRKRELEREKPEAVKTESRHIPAPIKKFVKKRSNCKCEFPDCKTEATELHHTNRFALDHTHDPDKLFALCHAHHKLAHRGLIENEELTPENWKIRTAPDTKHKSWKIDTRVQQHYR